MPAISDSKLSTFYVVGGVVLLLFALSVYAYVFPVAARAISQA